MSYTVLAVKWRPRRFEDLVGQQHVVQALVNSLAAERLHHAYLFTGTRGVGKTTVARILAKALNCEQGVVSEPCGVCAACTSIDQGRFVDLIEVDAASRTKVDDTRELLDNVQYAPSRGRYKVYLIDEVHMLSNHSFNALLKTLEEPPPHVKFLFATTDPQKLPITVLSRCLQFNLKRLTLGQIQAQLEKICAAEGVRAEPDGLKALAKAADGSVRDALSMLDQGIAFGGGEVKADQINAMLGTIDRGHVLRLLEALANEDGTELLDEVARLDEMAPDYSAVLDELMGTLQQLAVIQLVGDRVPDEDLESLKPLAEKISPEDVQLYYQIALQGKRDLPVGREPRIGVEMTLLRMLAFRPQSEETGATQSTPPRSGAAAARSGAAAARSGTTASRSGATAARPAATSPPPAPSAPSPRPAAPVEAAVTPSLAATAPAAAAAAPPAGPVTPRLSGAAAVKARLAENQSPPLPPQSTRVDREPPPGFGGVSAKRDGDRPAKAEKRPAPEAPPPDEAPPPWTDEDSAPPPWAENASAPVEADTRSSAAGPTPVEFKDWVSLIKAADIRGGARQLADHCEIANSTDKRIELILTADKATMNTEQLRTRLQTTISQHLSRRVTLTVTPGKPPRPTPAEVRIANENARMRKARESMEQDPNVKAAQEAFGAVLEADSIQPTDDH